MRKVPSSGRYPESNAPVSEVTVWLTLWWFVQQTVVPGATVTKAGEKA
jgi:hypothetical protein